MFKEKEAEENAKLKAEENLKYAKEKAEENPNSDKLKWEVTKAIKELEKKTPKKLIPQKNKKLKVFSIDTNPLR